MSVVPHPQLLPVKRKKTTEEELLEFIESVNDPLVAIIDDPTTTRSDIRILCAHCRQALRASKKEHLINYITGLETAIRDLMQSRFSRSNFELNLFLGKDSYTHMKEKCEYKKSVENFIDQ